MIDSYAGAQRELRKYEEYKDAFTEYVRLLASRSNWEDTVKFAEMRKMPIEEVKESGIFKINNMTELIIPKFMNKLEEFGVISPTNNKPIFSNRWVMPIKDTDKKVINLVGYSNEANERYVYGKGKYYSRKDTMYGLENLELAYDIGYGILTEGITDTMRVRSLGYKVSFAACGSRDSKFRMNQLNRCKYGIIRIPHRDEAGYGTRKHWITNRYITLNIPAKMNDLDDTVVECEDGEAWVKEYIDLCINWLKEKEHMGSRCACEEVTMM